MSHTWRLTWEASKGKGVSYCVVWRRRRKKEGDSLRAMGQIDWVSKGNRDSTLAKRSLHNKQSGLVITTRKMWKRGIFPKTHLSGGIW